ncbi:MAG: Stage V sporulation protein E [Candidatus Woesebacteria bacterium GW2011_GWB1_38_5b]|uniref:Probable peptidoglycan glycosyltransferase FtsW n=1 Tax=Candidatus Woesebacteria bacterium GW2011_GWB1_38_5b TaxID=1618569 RepID=A0A0G0NFS9_9BACT|nr:MAG: Stage V sporulation protein E [Candidatus Woesebacteria bacterium GW2011_GWB1_38_5b]
MARHNIKKYGEAPHKADRTLFVLTLILTFFGILAVADASAPLAVAYFNDSFYFAKQHLIWACVGVIAMLVVSRIHYTFWQKAAVPIFGLTLITLILVIIPGFGSKLLGARRWINLGFFSFQPSELVKLTLSIYFASLAQVKKNLRSYIVILVLVTGLMMLQPDLGTTIIIAGIGFLQIFIAGAPILSLIGIAGAGLLGGIVLILTSDYRRDRLVTFFESATDPTGTSYHISQVLIALGSGGIFGVGLGQSRQKYLFLPESATDSVFAVIAEEIGFVGASVLIVLFLFFVYKGIKIARKAPDRFSQLLAAGIVCWIAIQAFLNISSMVALTPLTGVPMPFFSYGGSSLTMILVGIGILLNISRYEKPD